MLPKDIDNLSKIKWSCRRGMLELDVILGNFLHKAYPSLTDKDKQLFITLLNNNDNDLFAWILGKHQVEDPDMHRIITLVRKNARSDF